MGWRDVLAQYSNRYEETVRVTAIDNKGQRQTIRSNRIHPYFARVVAGAILATASAATTQAIASEGHVYSGDIAGGAWVDAQHLKPGDELLSVANQWQRVESVVVEQQSLDAYNLTVADYSTFFVAGAVKADAVWVHNTCYTTANGKLPDGFTATNAPDDTVDFGQKWARGEDGRLIYQGHPPNQDTWYDPTVFPPTSNPTDKLPDGWESKPNKKGVGIRYQDPQNQGNGVRIDQGNPDHSLPSQRVDHVIVRRNGVVIGRDGSPIQGTIAENAEQAHIPLSEYLTWRTWYAP